MNAESKKRVRQLLLKHRGAQGEFAGMLGVSESFLSQWLRGYATSARLDHDVPSLLEDLRERLIRRGAAQLTENFNALAGVALLIMAVIRGG
jgi:transcriptional regulator with XRE-family HTH domain